MRLGVKMRCSHPWRWSTRLENDVREKVGHIPLTLTMSLSSSNADHLLLCGSAADPDRMPTLGNAECS